MGLKSPPLAYAAPAQGDFDVGGAKKCPTCGGPWKRLALRVCRRCGLNIKRAERYRVVPVGPGLFAVEHRACPK